MTETIVKYKSLNGKDYHSRVEAEAHDFDHNLRRALMFLSAPRYDPGYDGPMPLTEPTFLTLSYYRDRVRHMFLDLPEPEPVIQIKERIKIEYRFPHWAAWWSLILMGVVIGLVLTWVF